MALRIRMQRFGNTHRPYYHVVVTDSRNARDGRFIEKIGHYNPMVEPSDIEISAERIAHWYKLGARPSDSVANLCKVKKISLN